MWLIDAKYRNLFRVRNRTFLLDRPFFLLSVWTLHFGGKSYSSGRSHPNIENNALRLNRAVGQECFFCFFKHFAGERSSSQQAVRRAKDLLKFLPRFSHKNFNLSNHFGCVRLFSIKFGFVQRESVHVSNVY